MADTEGFLNDFDHRRQTVGGATGSGDDLMLGRIVKVVVHPHHHIKHVRLFHRRTHHHMTDALINVCLQFIGGFHYARALDHDIAVRPIAIGNCFISAKDDSFSIENDSVIGCRDALTWCPAPMN